MISISIALYFWFLLLLQLPESARLDSSQLPLNHRQAIYCQILVLGIGGEDSAK